MTAPYSWAPGPVRFEHGHLGAGSRAPRISWQVAPDHAAGIAGFQLRSRAADGREWRTQAAAEDHHLVPWFGPELASRESRIVQVRAVLEGGRTTDWGAPAVVEAGLLTPEDWRARFIGSDEPCKSVPVFRRVFDLNVLPRSARLYVTFLGIGRLRLNGQTVTEDVLSPGWQSYEHRLVYDTYDVTALMKAGRNVLEAEVGDGWYSGRLGFFGQRAVYGTNPSVIAQLEMAAPDGTTTSIVTDSSWRWRPGPTLAADLYDGETHDARLEAELSEDFGWRPVGHQDYELARLEARTGPPVRRTETIGARSIFKTPSGKVVVDFGQNLVGWARLRVQGPAGSQVTLRYAEVLEDGELGVRPLRSAASTDRYILRGGGQESWEPSFTYHGFRYLQVEGWPQGEPRTEDIDAVFVHTDMERTGWFRTSHEQVRKLHENVVASMRGNFVSIPTDCPQRDERLGWTGDIAIFAPTAAFLYDCTEMLRGWLRDVALEQDDDGAIPIFVPKVPFPPGAAALNPQFGHVHAAVWGDAATLVPFALYEATGDEQILAENYGLMKRWVDGVTQLVWPSRVWDTGFQFGDWLDPSAPPDDPARGRTDPALVATAYFAHSARLLSRAAELLGHRQDAEKYRALAGEVAEAFRASYLAEDGRVRSDSETAHAIVLCLDLAATDVQRAAVSRRLVELVRESGHHIATGFVGTPLILQALTQAQAIDDAYALLLQTECPSWLYAVAMGATSIWERWDSMLPDGRINPGEMTSFNHYALGAVASWLHSTVAGLSPDAPGYRRIRIAPRPRGSIRDAGASHLTPHGLASVDWALQEGTMLVEAEVPPGTTAVFDIEGSTPFECGPGHYAFRFHLGPRGHRASELPAARTLDESRL
ncbi:alpha-L-rhamnosidase [Sinomonas humi]|uniref:alpha-L-rhamnosidase n=1 Tax=Sinomonas humi TaxID=1338436 RepID=UPI0009DCD01E|nr:alpha-L-rhamnosidase [Sinomonas humi]